MKCSTNQTQYPHQDLGHLVGGYPQTTRRELLLSRHFAQKGLSAATLGCHFLIVTGAVKHGAYETKK
jgi:hypothetical protein